MSVTQKALQIHFTANENTPRMSACPREGKLQEAARPQVQEHTPFPRTGKLQFVIDQKQNLPQFQIRLPKVKGRLQPLAQANLFTHDNPSAGKTPRRRAA